MKPIQIVYFILFILGGLLLISYVFPENGIKVTKDFTIEFPTLNELLADSVKQNVDISEIIAQNKVTENETEETKDTIVLPKDKNLKTGFLKDSTVVYYKPVKINPKDVTCKLEFPKNNKAVINSFFKALVDIQNSKKLIRILHYGDSQIEQDRISSFLRYRLQKQFGGSGPGLVTPVQSYGFQLPIVSKYSKGWKRFPGFCRRDPSVKHNRYGVLASFGKYANNTLDSAAIDTTEYYEWLRFEHSPYARSNLKKYSQCRMFYGYNKTPIKINLLINDNVVNSSILQPNNSLQIKRWTFETTPSNFVLEFEGHDSPEVYALALDSYSGVAVDNIPLRGASGFIFTNSNTAVLQAIYRNLNAKLIILQFGGNAAIAESESYAYYEHSIYQQLKKLKRIMPDISIIVMGVADMSKKDKDKYVSMPSVKLIRTALKNAAFKADCAFWDTFKAMGGENSMPSWVFTSPPLAGKDFVHFTLRGSNIIAQMFYKALMLEYNNYLKQLGGKAVK